jgi:hypothetical protein
LKDLADDEISEEVLTEGCYYLHQLGMTDSAIAQQLRITKEEVEQRRASFESAVKQGRATEDKFDADFWRDVRQEAEGNVKVTFVTEKGFHHAWRSDLKKLDGRSLLAIYEDSKQFLDLDQNQRFLEYPAPKGYDPLAMQREVKRALGIISQILEEKWEAEKLRKSGAQDATGSDNKKGLS